MEKKTTHFIDIKFVLNKHNLMDMLSCAIIDLDSVENMKYIQCFSLCC